MVLSGFVYFTLNTKISSGLFLGPRLLKSCLARLCEIKGLDNDHGSFCVVQIFFFFTDSIPGKTTFECTAALYSPDVPLRLVQKLGQADPEWRSHHFYTSECRAS